MTDNIQIREIEFELIGVKNTMESLQMSHIDLINMPELKQNEGVEHFIDLEVPHRQFCKNVRGRKKRASSRSNITWKTKSLMKEEIRIIFNKLEQIELRLNNLKHI